MINCSRLLGLAACLGALGPAYAPALGATPPVASSPYESPITQGLVDTAPESVGPAGPIAREGPLERSSRGGNPLWAIPLRSLSFTRERPIFSPSRRPAPPAVVAAPYVRPTPQPALKPEEPDHPLLALVGTVVGETESIGVFLDQSAKRVISIRTGQGFAGWILRSVQAREATFEKNQRTAVLSLPSPRAEQSDQTPIPSSGGTQAGRTWVDGDGQMITPPSGITPQAQVQAGVRTRPAEPN
jgi:general secretion pathway protein N